MSPAPEIIRSVTAPEAAARAPATLARAAAPALGRRFAGRLGHEWLPRAAWTISRTGRMGLLGIALLFASALFLLSTHLKLVAEVEALRAELGSEPAQGRTSAADEAAPATAARALPGRADMPAMLRQLFGKAGQAGLVIDVGKYEINATGNGGFVRYQIALPVTGPYPQIRTFIDATLATMPAVALSDLVLDRKSIGDANVEAQIRLTAYTVAPGTTHPAGGPVTAVAGLPPPPRAGTAETDARGPAELHPSNARHPLDRVVPSRYALALFAPHSWYVAPPPPPPPAPAPEPAPTAPPFPYTFIGSFTPETHPPVFFLAHGDRVIDARVGDKLDGVYLFESAAGGQLVFVYLPLNVRQILAAGGSQ